MDFGETDIGQVVVMDCLMELILEALCCHLEGVIHLFFHFVTDEEFTPSLGRHIGTSRYSLGLRGS